MLVIELQFLNGRFHTTPWGRNVNEGVAEWPPSPYRLIRALFDVWKRKRPDWPDDRVVPLFELLASAPPKFVLPPAAESSTRSYLSENTMDVTQRQLVFDGFIVLDPRENVVMGWPGLTLTGKQEGDLDELLTNLNYFGRSESWVAAQVGDTGKNYSWNCYPNSDGEKPADVRTVPVAVAMNRQEYDAKPVTRKPSAKKGKAVVVPWLDALAWTTDDMFRARMSEPPAFRFVPYLRPENYFAVVPAPRTRKHGKEINAVMYSLESKVPPRIISALEIAEQVRVRLMGIHKKTVGDPAKVSPKFSGKSPDGTSLKGHKHTFILPLDTDRDGKIDHLLVRCRDPFNDAELASLDHLSSLWQADGKPEIRCIPLQWGVFGQIQGTRPSQYFRSETPFVPPRHYRKGRGDFVEWLAAEVRREARNHGLPEPVIVKPVERLKRRGHDYSWLEFRRNRKGDEAGIGYGFELEFAGPVTGPFTIGYGAHFGLGLFVQTKDREDSIHDQPDTR